MTQPRILAFAGSLRVASWNKKLIRAAAAAAQEAGGEVTLIDLRDYPVPVYDGDIEAAGLPENVIKLKALFKSHQGMLISSPEYNGGFSGVLKNVIDWVSRPEPGVKPLEHFKDKPVGIMGATPGAGAAARMLPQLRTQLANIGMIVVPGMYGLAQADKAFDAEGNLTDEKATGMISKLAQTLVDITRRLTS
jgi:NAD(P)H-dependent FMN reductase